MKSEAYVLRADRLPNIVILFNQVTESPEPLIIFALAAR